MPKKALLINKFSGGLNSYADPRDLKEDEFQILDNACVDEEGVIRVSGAFNALNNLYGENIIQGSGTPDYFNLPIAGKGFYTFAFDTYEKVSQNGNPINSNLESNSEDYTTAWGVTATNNDGNWLFNQTNTFNTNVSLSAHLPPGITESAICYVNMANANDGSGEAISDGVYDLGDLKIENIELEWDTEYRATICVTSDRPWYYIGGNIPPRIRIYNDAKSHYLGAEGFTSTSDATHNALLVDTGESTSKGDNGNLLSGDSSIFDWELNGSAANDAITNETLSATEFGTDADTDRLEVFNGNFGGNDVTAASFASGKYNVYKLAITDDGHGNLDAAGHSANLPDVTVEAETSYFFDIFTYNPNDSSFQIQILNASDSDAVIETRDTASSAWNNVSNDYVDYFSHFSDGDFNYPIEFRTPASCTRIKIRIASTISNAEIMYVGANLRKKTLELGTVVNGQPSFYTGLPLFQVFNHPRYWSWNNSSYSLHLKNAILDPIGTGESYWYNYTREFELNFTTPSAASTDDSYDNNWVYEFQGGRWSNLEQTGYLNIILSKMNIEKIIRRDNNVSEADGYYVDANNKSMFNFFNYYNNSNTSLNLIQSNLKDNTSSNVTSEYNLPVSYGISNYNMVKGTNNIYYCDETFNDKSLYQIGYDSNKQIKNYSMDFSGLSITSKSTGAVYTYNENNPYDAVGAYIDTVRAGNNDSFNGPFGFEQFNGSATFYAYPYKSSVQNYKFSQAAHASGAITISELEDGPGGGGLADTEKGLKYDEDASWLEADFPYTKYMTFSAANLLAGIGGVASRLGKIEFTIKNYMHFGTAHSNYKEYIPEFKIYVDVITADGHTQKYARPTNSNDTSDLSHFITNIATYNVNPQRLQLGNGNESWGLKYEQTLYTSAEFNESDSVSSGVNVSSYYHKMHTYNFSIDFPYDYLYDLNNNGTADTPLTISGAGINLQIRAQMIVKNSNTVNSLGLGDNPNTDAPETDFAKGIFKEHWRMFTMDIFGFDGDNSSSIIYQHVVNDDVEFVMNFDTPNSGSADGWDDNWYVSLTLVDNNNIESAFGDSVGFSNTDLTKCPDIAVILNKNNSFLPKSKFIKVYMKSKRNSNMNLQATIDLSKEKISSSSSVNEYSSYNDNPIIVYRVPREDLLIPNEIDSYESETGVLQEDAEDNQNLLATFKTAIIANNVMYAGNVYQNGEHYPDRMLKSPIGKYPLLPKSNFIDVATNDGDEITSLQFIKDKILQFKKDRLFIINVSDEYEYLEDTYDNLGITNESQVTMTQEGICWVNTKGCYLYTGSKVEYLTKKKIAYKGWKDSESSWVVDDDYNPSITYLKNENKLLIYPATESYSVISPQSIGASSYSNKKIQTEYRASTPNSTINDTRERTEAYYKRMGYQFDFDTKSWSTLCNFDNLFTGPIGESPNRTVRDEYRISNFQYDENNDTCFLAMGDDDSYYCKWNDNPHVTLNAQERDFRIITKDYDLDAPSVNKKIYKTYVTFKSTMIESNKSKKLVQNQDLYASSLVKVYYAINGSNTWTEFSTSSSTNYGTNGLISTDSEAKTTLAEDIDNGVDTQFTVASSTNIKVGYVLYIGNGFDSTEKLVDSQGMFEQMLVTAVSGTTITVERGYNNTGDDLSGYDSGLQVNISTGDWITAELKPSASINNIKSIKLKFEVKTDTDVDTFGVPPGFMINDITIIYRPKNVK
tara:strand:+ start:998 stop:6091 length:5094 start_codon:yes stop_codon:yes gene_type:complete